ncbi:MAG TPA: DinB family protein [Armatimonadota bacterium]|jgi:uncharacterized damage-inducible protein DinB
MAQNLSPRQALLLHQNQTCYEHVLGALKGVTEEQARRAVPNAESGGLFTGGTILGIVQHIITAKVVYGNTGFGDASLVHKWDEAEADVAARTPDLATAVALLHQAHAEWVAGWRDWSDAEMDAERPVHWGATHPGWRIAYLVMQHDFYHAGQIAMAAAITRSDPPIDQAA